MRFYPTKIHTSYVFTFFLAILLNFACSKDSDLLRDSILKDSVVTVDEDNSTTITTNPESEEEPSVEGEFGDGNTDTYRIISFPPVHDAHVQSGKGYNQNLIRLEENSRTSYLMFDLTPIAEIDGKIITAALQLTINSDDGNGSIKIHGGSNNDWTEATLSANTAPDLGDELGTVTKEFPLGETELIELNPELLTTDFQTLVLSHVGGNDVAFASKEHEDKIGPQLVISYEGSEEIIIEEIIVEPTEETEEQEELSEDNNPIAIADANPPVGGAPLEVTFTGSNSLDDKEITGYNWDFKDGTSATTANPTHTFTEVGVYEVELTVTDAEGLSSIDKVTIRVTEEQNNAPQAIVSATPTSGEAPLEVSFKGSDSTDDHSIANYGWDFKDGSKTNIADFNYTYTMPGVYEAELTVTDENGLTDKETIIITVTEPKNTAPVALIATNLTSGPTPLQVQFTGSNSTDDKAVTSYFWNFKNGTTSTSANPVNTFSEAGSYIVELTVKDAEGLTNKKSVTITATAPNNQAPNAVSNPSITSGEAPLTVNFIGDKSTDDDAVTSYSWNFKDGSTSTEANPSHTFENPGTYQVELTVTDANGLTDTDTDTINVSATGDSGGSGNFPPGFYVTPTGNSSNDGKSESKAWSLEHAFNTAKAGDVVYVKAGNYGRKELLSRNSGSSGNPIRFIGYRNSPGDVTSSQGSTFKKGESVDANKMPLLDSSNGQGTAITLYHRYIEIENFQINDYNSAVLTIEQATNITLRNVIVTNAGNQSNSTGYDGFGLLIKGNNTLIENCFIQNATAEAIRLFDSDYSRINYTEVHATNATNPTDYYYLLTGGTNNTIIENSIAERKIGLSHGGHGFTMKDLAEYNTVKNCTAIKTNIEMNFSGVKNNTVQDCSVYGVDTSHANWHAGVVVFNGANNNLFTNIYIQDTYRAIAWADTDDGYVGPGGDRDETSLGYDNTFDRITIKNTDRIVNVGGGNNFTASAKRNTFTNCDFTNFNAVAITYYPTEDIVFRNCRFANGNKLVVEVQDQYANYSSFDVSWENCTWTNVNFTPPN